MDCQAIYDEAFAAANTAAAKANKKLGPEASRGFDCGFAWLHIKPATGEFVTWLKAHGIGNAKGYEGRASGYGLWYTDTNAVSRTTQSISVHEAGVKAFAEVLRKHGLTVTTNSRLD